MAEIKVKELIEAIPKEKLPFLLEGIKWLHSDLYRYYFKKDLDTSIRSDTFLFDGKSISREAFDKEITELTQTTNPATAIEVIYLANELYKQQPDINKLEAPDVPIGLQGLLEATGRDKELPTFRETLEKERKITHEWIQKNTKPIYQRKTEAQKIAEAAQERANSQVPNLTELVPENIYIKPKDVNFVETTKLSLDEAKTLLEHVEDAHKDQNAKRTAIRDDIANKVLSKNPSLDKEAVENAADLVAKDAVSVLIQVNNSDIRDAIDIAVKNNAEVNIPFFDSTKMFVGLNNNAELQKIIPDTTLRNQFLGYVSLAMNDIDTTQEAVGTLAQEYFGIETTRILYPILNKDREKTPEYELTTEKDGAVGKLKVKELEQYANLQYLAQKASGYYGVDLGEKGINQVVNTIRRQQALQNYIRDEVGPNLPHSLDYHTSEIVAEIKARNDMAKAIEETFRGISQGYSIEIAVTAATQKEQPLLSFSTAGGLETNFLSVFKSIGGELVKRTIGKELTKKAVAFVGKQVVSKVAAAAGIGTTIGGPIGTAIGIAVGFALELLHKLAIQIKKHPEYIFLPVVGIGFIFGSPVLLIGGVGGGLLAATGGLGAAIGAIGSGAAAIGAAITGIIFTAVIGPIIAFIIGFPLLVALIYLIITNSAYVVPPGVKVITGGDTIISPYIGVTKVPSPAGPFQNSELPITITYTISITAKQGDLINIQIDYKCGVVKEGPKVTCPLPTPLIPDDIQIPDSISPTSPFVFSYTVTYDSPDFIDTLVTDTITVTADAPGAAGQTAAASATIKIGEPPEECPQGWPIMPEGGETSLSITQGPHGGFSHSLIEAIDVGATLGHAVTARHSGTAFVTYTSGPYEPVYIDIHSTCEGKQFSSRYAHLQTVNVTNGQTVTMDQVIGRSGTDGTGPHLHYEFRGLTMQPPYIPKTVPDGCSSNCGTIP